MIDSRKGNFTSIITHRTFNVVIVNAKGTGAALYAQPDKKVHYDGHKITVKL